MNKIVTKLFLLHSFIIFGQKTNKMHKLMVHITNCAQFFV